jgi:nicotinate-nucleotide pyrophosphorylase (carboxylating)
MVRLPEITDLQREAIRLALREDCALRDVTSQVLVPVGATGSAVIRAKQEGVLCGLAAAFAVFAEVGPGVVCEALADEGARVRPGQDVASLAGPLRGLLAGERTAVNLVQRMSGVATLTARFVDAVRGTHARILATRKTAPGLRAFDLAAVRAAGAEVHRESLADRVLVKENHLRAARAAGTASTMADVVALLARERPGVPVGIEAVDLDELRAALVPGVEVVLLDNFTPAGCAEAVRVRDAAFPRGGGPELEASGGITLDVVRAYAASGIERISVGALTHSVVALDVSMRILGE